MTTLRRARQQAKRTQIIAEVGINHNGDIDTALEMVESAASAGADAVKFQTFEPASLVQAGTELANYQIRSEVDAIDQLSMLKGVQLSPYQHRELFDRCERHGVEFMSTAFDEPSLKWLSQELKLKRLKIASGEVTNGPFLLSHAKIGLPIILSTGMASIEELDEALGVIGLGYLGESDLSREAANAALTVPDVRQVLRQNVTLLQCTTQYPAPICDANLAVLPMFENRYGVHVGYSDHTLGITSTIVAVALGASVIEKHFTLDRRLPGPDQKASLLPEEFKEMVTAIRDAEVSLGSGEKKLQLSEKENLEAARKSLFAACTIRAGETLSTENVEIKRPGVGPSPMQYWDLIGTVAHKLIAKGDPIDG